jgi:sec-independent protein translocase protein TatA
MVHAPTYTAAMLGGWEWLVILIIVLLLFGNRIPGLARSLGRGVNEFKSGLRDGENKPDAAGKADEPPARREP